VFCVHAETVKLRQHQLITPLPRCGRCYCLFVYSLNGFNRLGPAAAWSGCAFGQALGALRNVAMWMPRAQLCSHSASQKNLLLLALVGSAFCCVAIVLVSVLHDEIEKTTASAFWSLFLVV